MSVRVHFNLPAHSHTLADHNHCNHHTTSPFPDKLLCRCCCLVIFGKFLSCDIQSRQLLITFHLQCRQQDRRQTSTSTPTSTSDVHLRNAQQLLLSCRNGIGSYRGSIDCVASHRLRISPPDHHYHHHYLNCLKGRTPTACLSALGLYTAQPTLSVPSRKFVCFNSCVFFPFGAAFTLAHCLLMMFSQWDSFDSL